MATKTEFGTTFSQVQCKYLGFDESETKAAFLDVSSLFRFIRLGSYWNEIEPQKGQYDFQHLDYFLNEAQKRNLEIIQTVGMKAPRYPEYHFPKWVEEDFPDETSGKKGHVDSNPYLADLTLRFERKVIEHIKDCKNVSQIQVENEPLVKVVFAGNRSLSYQFLEKEVALARELKGPDQKILVNLSINTWPIPLPEYNDKPQLKNALKLADNIGVDIYPIVPARDFTGIPINSLYIHPMPLYFRHRMEDFQNRITEFGKSALVTEAQAEPWEHGNMVHIQKREYPSSNPKLAQDLALKLEKIGFNPVLLWGYEHWYWHKMQGHMEWWNEMQKLVCST